MSDSKACVLSSHPVPHRGAVLIASMAHGQGFLSSVSSLSVPFAVGLASVKGKALQLPCFL